MNALKETPSKVLGKLTLAKHIASGNLWLLMLSNAPHEALQRHDASGGGDAAAAKAIALISPSKPGWIYRNFVVAPSLVSNIRRIAVIWQDCNSAHQRSELYIYDIQDTIRCDGSQSCNSDKADNFSRLSASITSQPLLDDIRISTSYISLHSKRIRSLGWQVGGIHASSPIWSLPLDDASKTTYKTQSALAGIQILHGITPTGNEHLDIRKCFVWGPSDLSENTHHLTLSIFDFKYEHTPHINYPYQNPPEIHHKACVCHLHDDVYLITLPDIHCSTDLAKSIPTWQECVRIATRLTAATGSIVHYDPPARKEALEREQEELKEKIRQLRREGNSDFEIAETWFNARWSGWGVIPKPEGWKELR